MDLEITCIQMTASEGGGTLSEEIGHCPHMTEVCIIATTFFITGTKSSKAIHLLGSDRAEEKDYPDPCNFIRVKYFFWQIKPSKISSFKQTKTSHEFN